MRPRDVRYLKNGAAIGVWAHRPPPSFEVPVRIPEGVWDTSCFHEAVMSWRLPLGRYVDVLPGLSAVSRPHRHGRPGSFAPAPPRRSGSARRRPVQHAEQDRRSVRRWGVDPRRLAASSGGGGGDQASSTRGRSAGVGVAPVVGVHEASQARRRCPRLANGALQTEVPHEVLVIFLPQPYVGPNRCGCAWCRGGHLFEHDHQARDAGGSGDTRDCHASRILAAFHCSAFV